MGGMELKKQKEVNKEGKVAQNHGFVSGIETCKEKIAMHEKEILVSDYRSELLDGRNFDIESPSSCVGDEEMGQYVFMESKEEGKPRAFQYAAFKLFVDYGSRVKKIHGKLINVPSYEDEGIKVVEKKLSTNDIIRLGGEKFIEFLERGKEDLSMAHHLFSKPFFVSGLEEEDARDVELVFYLLASAEKIGEKQFDQGRMFLERCEELSSSNGDPVQRLVYYFSKALYEKIDVETMKTMPLNMGMDQLREVDKEMMSVNSTLIALTKVFPTCDIIQLAGTQAIVEHVGEAKRIHIIDFSIKGGQHHSMLIQALADECECHFEHLKITAVGTASKSKIEETGNRLIYFAQSLSLPFSFNVLMVDDILNLDKGLLAVNSDETVVVYSAYFFRSLLGQPDRLESLMRVIRDTKPCVMVVVEVESNHNSPVFVNRFIEALFYYGAQFDSLECMKNDETNRSILESFYFGKSIQNIVSTEGEQRTFREVKVEVWRSFFQRFGMLETPLSTSSLSQANLVRKNYSCGSSCTLDMDGESLIVGWKETPLYSISAWRFG